MAFWIFKCNPEKYRLSERLADATPAISWRVTKYHDEIGPGDTVFIWETGPERGIRAFMRALTNARAKSPNWRASSDTMSSVTQKRGCVCRPRSRGVT